MTRPSRTIRTRLAKRDAQRIAKSITIDRHGLLIEGKRFRHHIGQDIEIDHLIDNGLAMVTVGIFAETVDVAMPLPRHARITQTTH